MGDLGNGAFFIHQNGYTVLQHHPEDWREVTQSSHGHSHGKEKVKDGKKEKLNLRSHAYKVEFLGANPNPVVIPDKASVTYTNNFIGNDPSKWATGCKIYGAVVLKDVYPNIDVRYYSDVGRLKYDLIVNPGGNPSKIILKYDGADKLDIRNKELVVKTSVGDIRELSPSVISLKKREERKCRLSTL